MKTDFYVDSHCHLQDEQFTADYDKVIREASSENVKLILVPGIDINTSKQAVDMANDHSEVFAAVGVHPHEVSKSSEDYLESIRNLSKGDKILAIGEIGLDFYYDFSPRDKQINDFKDQVKLALELDYPMILHMRESTSETFKALHDAGGFDGRGVFHCFPGSVDEAMYVINRGFYISLPGIVTFKNADKARDVIKKVPVEKLLLETDSPYMAPVPYRGKRNTPAYIPLIAEKIAEIKGLSVEEIMHVTTQNFFDLFNPAI
jgi:TatD DNase family protein